MGFDTFDPRKEKTKVRVRRSNVMVEDLLRSKRKEKEKEKKKKKKKGPDPSNIC